MYGTPVLGADIGGIPELIHVGKTGELFESGNAEDLKKLSLIHILDIAVRAGDGHGLVARG